MTKKTAKNEQTRTVYEVLTSQGGARRVEAGSTAELRDALGRLLPGLEPYAVQAVARLASIERATVTAGSWSVRRVGVMQFQPDELVQRETKTRARPPRKPAAEKNGGQTSELPAAQSADIINSAEPPSAAQPKSTLEPLFEGQLLSVK